MSVSTVSGFSSDYAALVQAVHQATGVASTTEAIAILRATLETLAEFAPRDQAAHLAAHLPLELRAYLLAPEELPGSPSLGEFCCRLTVRENSDLLAALTHARGVIRVLMRHTTPTLVRAQFPDGFESLFVES